MFTQERKKKTWKNKLGSNNSGVVRNKYGTGVRSYLVNSGLDNSKIDYDTQNNKVTYNGKPVLSPNIVVDGTSYADEEALRTLALDLNRSEGKDLVSATDYAAQKTGIKNAAQVNDDYISIGGELIKPSVASDGAAYADREALEEAVDNYLNEIGYKSEIDIYNEWHDAYGSKLEKAIDEFLNENWEYSLEDDPAYKAYADMYKREGERAFSDNFGNLIANTGGFANSAALTAASQGLGYYMLKLQDRVPELMAADFERFSKQREQRLDAISELMDASSEAYDNLYSANQDYLNRISESNVQNYEISRLSDEAELEKKMTDSDILNNYIESEKGLIDLEYLPAQYNAELSEAEMELEYKPRLYTSELTGDILDQVLKALEIEYRPELYDEELRGAKYDNQIKSRENMFGGYGYWANMLTGEVTNKNEEKEEEQPRERSSLYKALYEILNSFVK